jgi:hypothetical protein
MRIGFGLSLETPLFIAKVLPAFRLLEPGCLNQDGFLYFQPPAFILSLSSPRYPLQTAISCLFFAMFTLITCPTTEWFSWRWQKSDHDASCWNGLIFYLQSLWPDVVSYCTVDCCRRWERPLDDGSCLRNLSTFLLVTYLQII